MRFDLNQASQPDFIEIIMWESIKEKSKLLIIFSIQFFEFQLRYTSPNLP